MVIDLLTGESSGMRIDLENEVIPLDIMLDIYEGIKTLDTSLGKSLKDDRYSNKEREGLEIATDMIWETFYSNSWLGKSYNGLSKNKVCVR